MAYRKRSRLMSRRNRAKRAKGKRLRKYYVSRGGIRL
jgi:hypothetical protein